MTKKKIKVPVEPPKEAVPPAKQYVIIVDDLGVQLMGRVCPGLKFLEVEGMKIAGHEKHQFLVNPLPQPSEVPS